MKKFITFALFLLLSYPPGLSTREKFDLRALLWWTPNKEIVLVIDYYTTHANILMQIDWKKIKGDRVTLEHDLIFLAGLRQVRLPLKTYTRRSHQKLVKIGTIRHAKDAEILLQNGINFRQEKKNKKKEDRSPFKNFGVPGFQ